MPSTARPLHPKTSLSLLAALCVALSACAQPPKASADAPAGSSISAAATTAAAAPATRPAAYAGHFESGCQQLGENFFTRDLIDLAPSGTGLEARSAKAIHDAEGCSPASLVVIFHMPPVQWAFDGTTDVQGRTVDRIQTKPGANGQLTASHARAGSLGETPTHYLLRRDGKGNGLPVDKAVEQVPSKELRLLTSQRLYTSPSDAAPEAYPTELDLENYLERKPSP